MYSWRMFVALVTVPLLGASCDSLVSLRLPDTTVVSAHVESGAQFIPPGEKTTMSGLPDFCRVQAVLRPSQDSNVRVEVWLPIAEWNGKFQGVGNGGFAGTLNYSSTTGLVAALRRRYATASTDTGHSGAATEGKWALRHPERAIDYGYRAIHLMTERSKEVIEAFYDRKPAYSYFASCSNGGRQALMEAQRYPQDYDGIIAGAPANNLTRLMAGFIWNQQSLARGPIATDKLADIESAVLRDCDASGGLKDGIVDRPDQCRPNLESFGAAEAETLQRIYSGPRDSKGNPIFDGFPPGAESGPGGWDRWIIGPNSMQRAFATDFLRYIAFGNPEYDYRQFDFDRDLKAVEAKLASTLNATDPNLETFRWRGGKLILFHGWNDPAIPAPSTIRYYEQIQRSMGSKMAGAFVRLYLAPGVQHCGGGPGPNSFGAYGERGGEMFNALEGWVEKGELPQRIVATNVDTQRTRPLCPYPQVARHNGSGSIDDAAAFECKAPK